MIKLPWGIIAGGVGVLGLIIAVIVLVAKLDAAQAKLDLAIEREARWEEQQLICEENQKKLTDALVDVEEKKQEIVILEARLQGETDAKHDQALEIAKAEVELDELSRRYQNLSTRAVDMDVCQTFELALAALAGGTS